MIPELYQWAMDWKIPTEALHDLMAKYIPTVPPPPPQEGYSEAAVQSRVRLKASATGMLLMRNNVGVLEDARGVPVRFGLANDSSHMNRSIKSSDLIGIRPTTVTVEMVGSVIGRFVALECKRGGWKYSGSLHEQAQSRFMQIVERHGGEARFINSEDQL